MPEEAIPQSETGDGAAPVAPGFKHLGSVISHSLEDIGRDLGETIDRLPQLRGVLRRGVLRRGEPFQDVKADNATRDYEPSFVRLRRRRRLEHA